MGMLFDDHLYISTFISGAVCVCVCVFKSLEIQFNMCQLAQSAGMIFFSPFISCGSSLDTGYEKKQSYWFFQFYSMSIGDGKVLRLCSDSHAVLPQLAWAVNSHLPVFLRSERRKTGICSFTAALIRGKLDFPVFLRSEGRKTGICGFTAVPIGGKVDLPVFLRSERRKTGNSWYAAGTYGGYLSIWFFNIFSLLLLVGG